MYRVQRFPENPLIHPGLDERMGTNINGPSLIRVPDWLPAPLGRYYLYFAHHGGQYIRMAYADDLHGPWTVYTAGVMPLEETACQGHIASPDVHICPEQRELVMYFHGSTPEGQRSFRAVSRDGLSFTPSTSVLGPFYFRVFRHDGAFYAIAKTNDAPGGGVLLRSPDGIQPFERGPDILPRQRHVALLQKDDSLQIFYTRGFDCPERILLATMSLTGDWRQWRPSEPVDIMSPEEPYEGADLPLEPSRFGSVREPVRQLRDPAVFLEDGRLYLFYSGAGESCLCAAELAPTN